MCMYHLVLSASSMQQSNNGYQETGRAQTTVCLSVCSVHGPFETSKYQQFSFSFQYSILFHILWNTTQRINRLWFCGQTRQQQHHSHPYAPQSQQHQKHSLTTPTTMPHKVSSTSSTSKFSAACGMFHSTHSGDHSAYHPLRSHAMWILHLYGHLNLCTSLLVQAINTASSNIEQVALDVNLPVPVLLELLGILEVSPRRSAFHQLIGAQTKVCHRIYEYGGLVDSRFNSSLTWTTVINFSRGRSNLERWRALLRRSCLSVPTYLVTFVAKSLL